MTDATNNSIIANISKALPLMSEFDRGYLLGKTEQILAEEKAGKEEADAKSKVS